MSRRPRVRQAKEHPPEASGRIVAYTDGGCSPNPGPGGWGVVILPLEGEPRELTGGEPQSTNNRMELCAALEALRAIEGSDALAIVTDSRYLRDGITKWIRGWRRSGWLTSERTPVKNRDLWEALDAEIARRDVVRCWTRGHSGNRWNDRADRLASKGIRKVAPPPESPSSVVHLYTAAAHSAKTGAGSWASLLRFGGHERELDGREEPATANRMHLMAAIQGLAALNRPARVVVYTVSGYVEDGATRWVRRWHERGWVTLEDRPVSNRDLWEEIHRLQSHHEITWRRADDDDEAAAKVAATKERASARLRGTAGPTASPLPAPDATPGKDPAADGSSSVQ